MTAQQIDFGNIHVALGTGEQLGNINGPAEFVVPPDPRNAEYSDLLKRDIQITPKVEAK